MASGKNGAQGNGAQGNGRLQGTIRKKPETKNGIRNSDTPDQDFTGCDEESQSDLEFVESVNEDLRKNSEREELIGHQLQNTESLETDDHRFLFQSTSTPNLAKNEIERIESNRSILLTMRKLLRAFRFSNDCSRSRWDFAIEINELRELGISTEELRWLIGKGLIDHAEETLESGHVKRTFHSSGGFSLSPQSCFVLTDNGLSAARVLVTALARTGDPVDKKQLEGGQSSHDGPNATVEVPYWDSMRHELWFCGTLVKKFKWRAVNQEAILAAFDEEGWPARIDDPLPPIAEMDPKRRLGDAIKCLNRRQSNSIVRFCGDGSGEGVLWEICRTDK